MSIIESEAIFRALIHCADRCRISVIFTKVFEVHCPVPKVLTIWVASPSSIEAHAQQISNLCLHSAVFPLLFFNILYIFDMFFRKRYPIKGTIFAAIQIIIITLLRIS